MFLHYPYSDVVIRVLFRDENKTIPSFGECVLVNNIKSDELHLFNNWGVDSNSLITWNGVKASDVKEYDFRCHYVYCDYRYNRIEQTIETHTDTATHIPITYRLVYWSKFDMFFPTHEALTIEVEDRDTTVLLVDELANCNILKLK